MPANQPPSLNIRLAIMMFLEFASKGVWFVVVAGHMEHLGFNGRQMALVYACGSVGALLSPMLAGWLADRIMAAQRFAALCHGLNAIALFIAWQQTDFYPFFFAILAQALLSAPTIVMANAISFHHLPDSEKFGHIRIWGTLGWMTTNWALAAYLWQWSKIAPEQVRLGDGLLAGALCALLAAVYSLSLPHTPPARHRTGESPLAFLKILGAGLSRNAWVLLSISFIGGMILPFFYNFTFLFLTEPQGLGLGHGPATLAITLGQVAELGLMVLLVFMLRRFGMRTTLLLGLTGLTLRAAIFAMGQPTWLVVAAQTLHGVDYTFFFVAGIIGIERITQNEHRASMQSLMNIATYGAGMLAGHLASGVIYDVTKLAHGGHNWTQFFLVPMALALAATLGLSLLFRNEEYNNEAKANM